MTEIAQFKDDFLKLLLQEDPVRALWVPTGTKDYDGLLGDYSPKGIESIASRYSDMLSRLDKIKPRDRQEELDKLTMREMTFNGSLSLDLFVREMPGNHMDNPLNMLETYLTTLRFNEQIDVDHYVERIGRAPTMIKGLIEGFELGIKKNVTIQKSSAARMATGLKSFDCKLYDPTKRAKQKSFNVPSNVTTLVENLSTAYKDFADFIEKKYMPHAREELGICSLPGGKEAYQRMVGIVAGFKNNGEPELSAQEIHDYGWEEVRRNTAAMDAIKSRVYKGTLKEFLSDLKQGKITEVMFKNREQILSLYNDIYAEIEKKLPTMFNQANPPRCNILPMPSDQEDSMPMAYYKAAEKAQDGTFYYNAKTQLRKPLTICAAVFLHEAEPGHHRQLSLRSGSDSHPVLKLSMFLSVLEGWGLYCEGLGEEMNIYDNDYKLFGRHELDLERAIRLVVDTGIHYLGWNREQCAKVFRDYTSYDEEEIGLQVDRYANMPAQGLSYKVGERKIRALRKKAVDALGDKFDLKSFHDTLIYNTNFSFSVLESEMQRWIDGQKSKK